MADDVESALNNRRDWAAAFAANDKTMQMIHPYNRFEGQNEYDAEILAQGYELQHKELADHKRRLAAQSARLAAAESEVRRLRDAVLFAANELRTLASVCEDREWSEVGDVADRLNGLVEGEGDEC